MTYLDCRTSDGTAQAYLARPAGGTGHGVLLFMDAFGIRPQIERMCDRVASWGYVVLAPNLFYRSGTIEQLAPTGDLKDPAGREAAFAVAGPIMASLGTAQMIPDIDAYLDLLLQLSGVEGPLAVTGYCMGARWATYAAGHRPQEIVVAGGFHGGHLVTDAADSPHRSLAGARAEFVYGHADHDPSMPPAAVTVLGDTLQEAGLTFSNEIYPDAPHGYSMSDTSSYQEHGAERMFRELRGALDRQLPTRA